MALQRRRNWAPPLGSDPNDMLDWVQRHYQDHVRESSARIADFSVSGGGGGGGSIQQVVSVAKEGGDFTTIQAAIDSIGDATTTKRYCVLVYPGEYAETITGKSFVEIMGLQAREAVNITGATGPLYTFPDDEGHIFNLKFSLSPTTSAQDILDIPVTVNARQVISNCLFVVSSASDVATAVFDVNGGEAEFINNKVIFTNTNTSAGTIRTQRIWDVDGDAIVDIVGNIIDVNIYDINDRVLVFDDASTTGGEIHIMDNVVHVTSNNAGNYTGIVRFITYVGATATLYVAGNAVYLTSLEAAGGTGTADFIRINSVGSGVVYSTSNQVNITGFTTNHWANVAAGDTVFSHFDDFNTGVPGTTGAGTFTYVNSPEDGDVNLTGTLTSADVITKSPIADVRAYADFATAISTIGATETTLLIPTQQAVTDNATVPATMQLLFTRGGSLNISNAKVVTINGPMQAGLFQIFEGLGTVAFGSNSVPCSHPQWWGALVDGTTDDTAAIEAADAAGRPVCLTKGNWGIKDLDFAKPPIFMTACELTVLTGVSAYGVKFSGEAAYKGPVMGSVYLDMSGAGTDDIVGVLIDGRFWNFPKISVKGSGKANGQIGISLQDHTNTALTHNQIQQISVVSCDIGFRIFLDGTGDNWAINNRLHGGYIQLCTYGMEFRDDDGTYGCRQNEWDCYVESCDYGVCLNGSNASKALMVCYNDLFNIKFDAITSNQWVKLEGNASGDLTPWMTFFSRSNLNDIFLQSGGTYTYLHSDDFTQVDLSRIRQLQAWGEEVISYAISGGGTTTIDCNQARYHRFVVADNTAFTIGSPNNGQAGEIVTIDIYNNSGGAMGAITWGANWKLAGAFTNPADTKHRLIQFIKDNETPVWREVNRTAADQAN